MANVIFVPLFLQLALGIYLKLHINEETIRPWAVRLHSVVGKSYPIFGWIQMLFGAIAIGGYCRGDNLGQCLAHYIMVSPFLLKRAVSRASAECATGRRLHCLRNHHGHLAFGGRGLDSAFSKEPRVVGLVGYYALGAFPCFLTEIKVIQNVRL